jgi:hypothetical protein
MKVIHIVNNFLSGTQGVQQLKERIGKWDYMKLKSFCTTKEMVCKLRRPPTEWEKIFASFTSDKGLIIRICKELKKLHVLSHMENIELTQMQQYYGILVTLRGGHRAEEGNEKFECVLCAVCTGMIQKS